MSNVTRMCHWLFLFGFWISHSSHVDAKPSLARRTSPSQKNVLSQKHIRRALRQQTLLSVYGAKRGKNTSLQEILRIQKLIHRKIGTMPSFPRPTKKKKSVTLSFSPQEIIILGGMSRTQVHHSLRYLTRLLKSCLYRGHKQQAISSVGHISFRWNLRPNGHPVSVTPLQANQKTLSPQVMHCVSKRIKHFSFPKPSLGSAVTLQISWRWFAN